MKIAKWLRVAVITTASCFTIGGFSPATASVFENIEVDPNDFIAIAVQYQDNVHKLLIVEQVSSDRACWSENNSESPNNPVLVDPLLMTFDFTGICQRNTDSNGYSIRMNGQDLGSDYLLTLVEREGEIVLVGIPRPWAGRKLPRIEVGRTRGYADGNEKIFLDPGWRFTKRTYQGRVLGHVYLTNDSAGGTATEPYTSPQPTNSLEGTATEPYGTSADPYDNTPETVLPDNEPMRELIFEPQSGVVDPFIEKPETSNQTPASESNSESTVPVFVVPVR
jgi:N-acetylmuramoyl-L-alanine amidase